MATRKFLSSIDLSLNELINAKLQNLGSPPTTLGANDAGFTYYNTGDKKVYTWSGTQWISNAYTHPNHSGDVVSAGDGATTIQNNTVTLAKMAQMNTGKLLGRVTAGTGNVEEVTLSTDTNLGVSDTIVSTQKAVKTYVDNAITVADVIHLIGPIDCSINPNYPDGNKGDSYKVSVAGKIGGASGTTVRVGALIICWVDGSLTGTQAVVGANWTIQESDLDEASTSTPGFIQLATQSEVSTGTNNTKAITPSTLIGNHPSTQSIGKVYNARKFIDNSIGGNVSQSVHHGLNGYVTVQLIDTSTTPNTYVECEVDYVDENRVTFKFTTAPAANSLTAIFIG